MSNKKRKRKEKKNKLKLAPTAMRNDKQREEILLFLSKDIIIKQVRENQDEVHEVYPIDQVKLRMEHKDIQVEM